MRRIILPLLMVFCFMFNGLYVHAWSKTGHRIIAGIAENHLDRKAKKELKKLIGDHSLAYWSTWADLIKQDTTGKWQQADPWHYINFPGNLNRSAFDLLLQQQSSKENLYNKIVFFYDQLHNKNLNKATRTEALYFLVHLMGDVHQPMHVGRFEDLGGNRTKVEWFGKTTNLHALWDYDMIDHQKWSYSEFVSVLDVRQNYVGRGFDHGNFNEWFYDSYQCANIIYAYQEQKPIKVYEYEYFFYDMLHQQLLKGGLRLARVLNDALK